MIYWLSLAGALVLFILSWFRVMREYERAVVFLLGRFWKVKGPGLIIIVPIIQKMVRVDLRTIVMDVPTQDVISHDNVSVKVNAVVYFRVIDPEKAIIQVENGKYLGFGFAEPEQINGDLELLSDCINYYPDNRDVQTIIRGYLKRNKNIKIFKY